MNAEEFVSAPGQAVSDEDLSTLETLLYSAYDGEDFALAEWDADKHPRDDKGQFAGGPDLQQKIADYKPERPLTGPDSKSIGEVIHGAQSISYFDTPGIEAMHAAMGMSHSTGMSKEYEDARNKLFRDLPVRSVPFDKLTYTQERINLPRVNALTKAPAQLEKTVFVVHTGTHYYVMNGHHRVLANYVAGNKSINAHVFNV